MAHIAWVTQEIPENLIHLKNDCSFLFQFGTCYVKKYDRVKLQLPDAVLITG